MIRGFNRCCGIARGFKNELGQVADEGGSPVGREFRGEFWVEEKGHSKTRLPVYALCSNRDSMITYDADRGSMAGKQRERCRAPLPCSFANDLCIL